MFTISSKYLNKRCGLHLKEYQKSNPNDPSQLGIINSKGKFTTCNCREHISRQEYDIIIPKIIDELNKAGLHKTLEHFNKEIDIKKEYENLKKDNVDINSITAQKTSKSNLIIKSRQYHLYDVKDHNGLNIEMNWNNEGLIKAFKQLDKPNYTVNACISELLKKFKYSPVSVYSPIMTKRILEELGCRSVFDPCIGWGGRMVGTTCLDNGIYIGCEPCTTTYQGLERIKNDLDLSSQVILINKPVEEALDNELKDMKFECCLTSPPYYDLEIYSDEDTQSIKKFNTYELWLEKFIDPIIKYVTEHCTKFSCWSVKDFKTDKFYPFQKDVVKIHEKYGWKLDREYGIKKSTKNGPVYGDITYIFKKSNENIEVENQESEPEIDIETNSENIDNFTENLSDSSETNLHINVEDVVEDNGDCNVCTDNPDNIGNNGSSLGISMKYLKQFNNDFKESKKQLEYYIENNTNPEILYCVSQNNKEFGEKYMEKLMREYLKLEKKSDSSYDHIKNDKKIEQKSARFQANGSSWQWQHIEINHEWDILMIVGVNFKSIDIYVTSRKIVSELIDKNIIKGQGKKDINGIAQPQQGYHFKKSDFSNEDFNKYFTKINNEDDIVQYINSIKKNEI